MGIPAKNVENWQRLAANGREGVNRVLPESMASEFAAKFQGCPRWRHNFIQMAENRSTIGEIEVFEVM
jgi:hypothetical protein